MHTAVLPCKVRPPRFSIPRFPIAVRDALKLPSFSPGLQLDMGDLDQIKRDLLDAAVVDNVENLRGGRSPARAPRAAKGPRSTVRVFATLLVPLAFLGLGYFLLRTPEPVGTVGEPVAAAAAVQEPEAADPAQAADQLRFAAPVDIDPNAIPLEIRKIIIDPGHGGGNGGTSGKGLEEKTLTLDIAKRLRDILEEENFEVALTREEDVAVDLQERVTFANEAKGDLFLSIHVNWISDRAVRGVETFYLGGTDDPELNALARKENIESGYSMADFRTLLQGIYVDVQQHESRALATSVQSALYNSLLETNPRLRNRGVKTAPFVVLIGNEMPAILAEVACLSNDKDAELLNKPRYREFIAESLAKGIRRYADSHRDS